MRVWACAHLCFLTHEWLPFLPFIPNSLTLICSFIPNCYIYYNGFTQLRYSSCGKTVFGLCYCVWQRIRHRLENSISESVPIKRRLIRVNNVDWDNSSRALRLFIETGSDQMRCACGMVRQVLLFQSLYLATKEFARRGAEYFSLPGLITMRSRAAPQLRAGKFYFLPQGN